MSKSTDQNSKPTKRTDFWAFVKNGSIRTVSVMPPLVACLLGIIWVITKEKFFPAVPEIYNYAVLSVALILTGFVGIIYIYTEEKCPALCLVSQSREDVQLWQALPSCSSSGFLA